MANRSYLYSINQIPGTTTIQTLSLKGLSEFKYDIPLSFLLLVSGHPIVCDSLLGTFTEKVSVAGIYAEGVANLKAFGQLMMNSPIKVPGLFKEQLDKAVAYLERPDIKQEYIFLDLGEIYQLIDMNPAEDVINRTEAIFEAIAHRDIAHLPVSYFEDDCNLFTGWEETIGLNDWYDALYFDFPHPFTYKTPFEIKQVDQVKQQQDLSAFARALHSHSSSS